MFRVVGVMLFGFRFCGCIVNSVGICFSFFVCFYMCLLISVLGCLCCEVCVVLVVVYRFVGVWLVAMVSCATCLALGCGGGWCLVFGFAFARLLYGCVFWCCLLFGLVYLVLFVLRFC